MRVALLESIVMPAGHEVEFDRILVDELKNQGHEPVFFVPKNYPFKLDYKTNIEYLDGGEALSHGEDSADCLSADSADRPQPTASPSPDAQTPEKKEESPGLILLF